MNDIILGRNPRHILRLARHVARVTGACFPDFFPQVCKLNLETRPWRLGLTKPIILLQSDSSTVVDVAMDDAGYDGCRMGQFYALHRQSGHGIKRKNSPIAGFCLIPPGFWQGIKQLKSPVSGFCLIPPGFWQGIKQLKSPVSGFCLIPPGFWHPEH